MFPILSPEAFILLEQQQGHLPFRVPMNSDTASFCTIDTTIDTTPPEDKRYFEG
jgi:hypothetical protein